MVPEDRLSEHRAARWVSADERATLAAKLAEALGLGRTFH